MADEEKKSGILSIFGDIRPGEAGPAFLMLFNLMVLLVSYYIIKVVREPLILAEPDGARWKSYAAAGQAAVLMGYVPLYAWFSSKVNRKILIVALNVFFIVCIELFSIAVKMKLPYVGVAFFIWVGIFSLSLIAQFWSLANDVYSESEGKRIFPLIAIGATAGSPIGAKLASWLFKAQKMPPHLIMQVSAVLLILSLILYAIIQKKEAGHGQQKVIEKEPLGKSGGFQLLFRSRYLLLIAALLLLLNLVNTTGEFILSSKVVEAADKFGGDKGAFIGGFYGDYFFVVNIAAFLIQTFLVSRIVKFFGIAGVVLALPLIALGAYTTIAAGVGIAIIRWMKTAENSTDYSVMNTARAMLWLPTSREEKYKAKQAVDTFVVRFGDVISAGLVYAGTEWLGLNASGFAIANIFIVLIWLGVGVMLVRKYKQMAQSVVAQ
jgi:AAA family ATP:ADP antiporter